MTEPPTREPSGDVEPDIVRNLLQHVPLGAQQTVIVTRGPQVIAHRGSLKLAEALDVAAAVVREWRDTGQTLRIQYLRLPLSVQPHLLLTYPLRDEYALTIVDHENAPLSQLRKLSNQLLGILEVAGIGRKPL